MKEQPGLTLGELLQWEIDILQTKKQALLNAQKNIENEDLYKYYMNLYEITTHQYSLLQRLVQQAKGE